MPTPLTLKLSRSGLLTDADLPVIESLSAQSRPVEAGQVLIHEGEHPDTVHLMVEGFAHRYKILPEGRRQIVGLMLPGDFCDLQATILGSRDHSIAALTAGNVAELPQRLVDDLILSHSRIARALWWATLVEESILRAWLTNLGQREGDRRMAHLFCEMLVRLQVVGRAGENGFVLPFSQVQLGDLLGLSNVHVSRVLQDLRGQGLIVLKDRRLEVPSVPRLKTFCDFDPGYLHLSPRRGAGSDARDHASR
ncbi:Crp/Fnr family transcriptional regulator [Methylobacterium trifolii]|uniref:Transcriptional activator protein Anr n=1 Tax=Methylobacterium trifolii TaxID=1003092 RepID=A0ABQ4U0K7_9HYPH|nr:Crp/Fnr family transcriptional regulator [Methylobacterium trifolii]GJE59655.1 Transcriptional activator protein Anr [Methylobacterium trifolii]